MINETFDFRPDHNQFQNLFHQVQPSCLVASGANTFISEIVDILDLQDVDINKYKMKSGKSGSDQINDSNLAIYSFNRKSQSEEYRKTIYDIEFPGLSKDSSAQNRKFYIDSVLPMNQELTVIAIGNLFRYLRDNFMRWKNVFVSMNKNLIITNVTVKSLDKNVMVSLSDEVFN